MLLVYMGKIRFGGIIWGEVVIVHAQKFAISIYFLRVPPYLLKGCRLHYSVASSDVHGARSISASSEPPKSGGWGRVGKRAQLTGNINHQLL